MRMAAGGLLALLAIIAPASSRAEEGDSWTNRAGHALKATPQSISGRTVTFVQGGKGKTLSYPLSVFLPLEQERLRCRLKDTTLPEGLQAAHDFAARVIQRARLLKESGGLPDPDFQKAVAAALAAFRLQAAPFITQQELSPERLDLIAGKMTAPKDP